MPRVMRVVFWLCLLLAGAPFAGGASAAAGPCDSSIFPIKVGTRWNYRMAGSDAHSSTITITQVSDGGFTERHEFSDVKFDVGWRCLPEGLRAMQRATFGVNPGGPEGMKFETMSAAGVRFPPRSRWTIGVTWTETYTLRMSMPIPNAPMKFDPMTFTHRYRIVGRERVSVPAGSFDAFKLAITEEGEDEPPAHFWVADGVGVVRADVPDDGKVHRVELVKFQR
ncbi:MAG: hypothetical protein ACREJ9_15415 [Candidatus Rokuibacteriota bacterium]